jgi:ankyrin repeat protein
MSLNEKRKSWIIVDDIDTWTPPSVKRIESLRTTESIISKIKDEDIQFYNAWLKDNKKVNVNWRNKFDDYKTPLISAIRNKKNNISGLLLKLPDIDITIRSASGWNAFDYALAKGNSEAVSQLVGVSGINFQYEVSYLRYRRPKHDIIS